MLPPFGRSGSAEPQSGVRWALERPLCGSAPPHFASPANSPCLLIRACKTSFTFLRYAKWELNYFLSENLEKKIAFFTFSIDKGMKIKDN
jgi:hypothetical protein